MDAFMAAISSVAPDFYLPRSIGSERNGACNRPSKPRVWLCAALILLALAFSLQAAQEIKLDASRGGRVYEGMGALSAGASSKLLIDYPEPQRRQILDLLFKPKFAASLQHLKIEIGGDVNSTDGTEPAYAHTLEEYTNRISDQFLRGYEVWLMQQARQCNSNILFECLQWGAPYWIGEFYSQLNADFIATFHRTLRDEFNLPIQYQGIWNEVVYNSEWIKLLRRTLDDRGLSAVKIVAADQIASEAWTIVARMQNDPELASAIHVVGDHYLGYRSTAAARKLGKPLWCTEDGPWAGDWDGAMKLARIYNRSYIEGRLTKVVTWALISSYYDNLPLASAGLMRANTPWSGHFEVQPAIWAVAHHTQFVDPGWKYLDGGCGYLDRWGSYVTYQSPDGQDLTLVIETMDSPYTNKWASTQTIAFTLDESLPHKPMALWRTDKRDQFEKIKTLVPVDHRITLDCVGDSIYTLSTTTGQNKGDDSWKIPAPATFPLPYSDDFDSYAIRRLPKYFIDQSGVFETAKRPDGEGKCLRLMTPRRGIEWPLAKNRAPFTVIGDPLWQDYEVGVDTFLEEEGFIAIYGRVDKARPFEGYWFGLDSRGRWGLFFGDESVARGETEFVARKWRRLGLRFEGSRITLLLDDKPLHSLTHEGARSGLAGFGCGWMPVCFDNFTLRPVAKPGP
jgi:hypothetical protein